MSERHWFYLEKLATERQLNVSWIYLTRRYAQGAVLG